MYYDGDFVLIDGIFDFVFMKSVFVVVFDLLMLLCVVVLKLVFKGELFVVENVVGGFVFDFLRCNVVYCEWCGVVYKFYGVDESFWKVFLSDFEVVEYWNFWWFVMVLKVRCSEL